MSEKNRDSFKLVGACSVALVAIAATCVLCVRSAAKQPKIFRPKAKREVEIIQGTKREDGFKPRFSIFEQKRLADSLVSLLSDYNYIVEGQSEEYSPTILRQIRTLAVWADDKDPNKITVTLCIPVNKEDIPEWVGRTERGKILKRQPLNIFTLIFGIRPKMNPFMRLPHSDLPPNLQPEQPPAKPSSEP